MKPIMPESSSHLGEVHQAACRGILAPGLDCLAHVDAIHHVLPGRVARKVVGQLPHGSLDVLCLSIGHDPAPLR